MADELRRHAEAAGILPEYWDNQGQRRIASEPVLQALLAALHEEGGAPPGALLPPVLVLAEPADALRIPLGGRNGSAQRLRWRLIEESGREQGGDTAWPEPGAALDIALPAPLPPGYHRIELRAADAVLGSMPLMVTPSAAWRPEALRDSARVFGPALQLYALRSARNWGIGDFTDLLTVIDQWAAQGADLVALNPLHALFAGNPGHDSPYSPSSRLFLNTLYLDVEAAPEFAECDEARARFADPAFQVRLAALRESRLVDYEAVSRIKREMLELLYRHFRARHLERESDRGRAFRHFQRERGAALRSYALFEALWAHFHERDPDAWGWLQWPEEYRDPASPAVRAFGQAQPHRVEFFEYLQWLAHRQLADAARRCRALGLAVGLYLDLAVSIDRNGADAWCGQADYAIGASVGAPPDAFNPRGQDWGLPPWSPRRLRERAYAPFIDALRESMRHAGALRIDHVMGLMRLFWVPQGYPAAEGAYVRYDFDALLGIVALESVRNRCLVVGEDLGTVPDEVREAMARLHLLVYRPLLFARSETGDFLPPARYPREALVAVSTHDLPTLAGWWEGRDLTLRAGLALFDSEAARDAEVLARAQDRARLLLALSHEGLLPEGVSVDPLSAPAMTEALARAVHALLARTPSQLMLVQPEDVLLEREQANLPGSTGEAHPNWRRRLSLSLEHWPEHAGFAALAAAVCEARGVLPQRLRAAAPRLSIPRATYRLQLNARFGFRDAAALAPYLAALGVSHVYCSPYLKARAGSEHGYDIIDHNALNPEIGSASDYEAFLAALREHRLGQMIDVVPNHMGVMGADNAWWLEVLENGPAAEHAGFFDIEWEPLKAELAGRVLLPVLGDHYGAVLERGELRLAFDATRGEFSIHYYGHRLPIDPREYPRLLEHRAERLASRVSDEFAAELKSLATAFGHLPARRETSPEKVAERARDKEIHKRRLAGLVRREPALAGVIEENVAEINGVPGEPASFDALHALIAAQAWRPAFWRVASDEINYRRFFDINDLAGLRMENAQVFEATHRLVLDAVAREEVQCLRIDHPDGLYDPGEYFTRLQQRFAPPGAPADARPIYLVIEKITADGERLPATWPVYGTSGYRFANLVNGLFVDQAAEARIDRVYRSFTGMQSDYDELLYGCKRLILRTALAAEVNVLANALARIAASRRRTCDYPVNTLREALTEVAACFPVYRSYVGSAGASEADRACIDRAVAAARPRTWAADLTVFDFVHGVLTSDIAKGETEDYRERVLRCAMKFQQLTAPATAKGMEDTCFYRYNRLVSLNEVGGNPRRFGVATDEFHAASLYRCEHWPHTMLATSTHDSKRAEDVRTRIDAISEMPALWRLMLRRWSGINRRRRREVDGRPAPSRNDEYLLYQTLLGTWPLALPDPEELAEYRERIDRYMLKAAREAKVETSWISPNAAYEDALSSFVAALLDPGPRNRFLPAFVPTAQRAARFGLYNSLSQLAVKLSSPGVPDIYQGNELWDFSLVDPDNRRPVDYAARRALLERLQAQCGGERVDAAAVAALLGRIEDGAAKLFLTWRTLAFRRAQPELFRDGDYRPLAVRGERREHLLAYARRRGPQSLVVLAPRLWVQLLGEADRSPLGETVWGDTEVALEGLAGPWRDILTGEPVEAGPGGRLRAGRALARFPVALLHAQGTG